MSKTNWLKTVNDINHKRYVIPDGWETCEQVAESLKCDPTKVSDLLKPGVQSGDIEKGSFPVWNANRRMAVNVTCYRIVEKGVAPKQRGDSSRDDRIASSILRNTGYTDRQIAKNVRGVSTADVARVRATMES